MSMTFWRHGNACVLSVKVGVALIPVIHSNPVVAVPGPNVTGKLGMYRWKANFPVEVMFTLQSDLLLGWLQAYGANQS